MAEPARDHRYDIEPDVRPNLRVIQGGKETDERRANLQVAPDASETARSLQNLENSNVIQGPWSDTKTNVKDAEETPQTPWKNSVSGYGGNKTKSGHIVTKANVRAVWKKRGIWGVIALLLGMLGIGGAFLIPSALLPIHIMENMIKRFDTQNTSFTIRSNRVLANKLTKSATDGSCDVIKIACRFSKPSNHLLKSLVNNKIVPLNANGDPIDTRLLWPNERPSTYRFTDSKGNTTDIKASELSRALDNNTEFRAAMHTAFNPRWVSWGDSVAKSIFLKFGMDERDKLSDVKDEQSAKDKLNEAGKGETRTVAAEEADSLLSKILKDKFASVLGKLSKSGKGSGLQMAAVATCMAVDTPRIFTSIARGYELAKLIPFATAILTSTSAMKASKATNTEMTAIGDSLTTVVNNKSAMDSAGMRSLLYGDTKFDSNSYQRFVPGGSVLAQTGGAIKVLSQPAVKNTCGVATNPITGAALNMILVANSGETFGATLVIAGVNLAVGWIASEAINSLGGTLIDLMMPFIKPVAQNILQSILGDLTHNISGADFGDAYVSGASHMMGQVANAGGNVPLTVDQAVQYNQTTQAVQAAYAQEDRIALSPLDATNSNTMLGSFVNKLIPYYSQMGTLSGVIRTLGTITTNSIGSVFTANAATTTTAQYQLCNDPSITEAGVAAGLSCNIYYGIPNDYLGADPDAVLKYMIDNKQADEDTGEAVPGSEYDNFKQLCTDGSTDQLPACTIGPSNTADTNNKLAMFALWTNDHRAQKIMDNQDGTAAATGTTTSTSTTNTGSAVKGDDYPYKNGPIDIPSPLGYLTRECVDFVTWRLNEQSGTTKEPFNQKFMGFGNAVNWRDRATAAGFKVDQTPKLGSVAWWGAGVWAGGFGAGDPGHVAIVSGVNSDGSIVIEQYNVAIPGKANYHEYSSVTISASDVKNLLFIHMADIGA